MKYLIPLLTFILAFLIVFAGYFFYYVKGARRDKRVPVEALYIINWKRLNTKLFSYRKFILTIAFVSSFDIAFLVTVLTFFKGLVWQILFGLVLSIPLILVTFMLVANYYNKKQHKDNSKELEKERIYLEKLDLKEKKKEEKKMTRRKRK